LAPFYYFLKLYIMWNLKDKKVVITGGTKGIGRATVLEYLKLGAKVLFTARNKNEVLLFEKELGELGFEAHGLVGDISEGRHQDEILNWINYNWESLDILVNNAGINIRKATLDYTVAEYRKIIDINLIAPFELSRLLFEPLIKGTNPSIINIASIAGILDVRTGSPYGMSKAGLIQQTKTLAAEWAKSGIRVNAVSPWFTETPLTEKVLHDGARAQEILSRTPLNRVAQPEEMANIIAFLGMDKASYITGQNIIADGGMSVTAL
jgi:Tropinone reductase 1